MKKSLLITTAILMGTVGYVNAGNGNPNGQPTTFAEMDVNGDGVLSKDEVQGRLLANFDRFDADESNTLSEDEMPTRKKGGRKNRPAFADLDSDSNGSISEEEFAAQPENAKKGKQLTFAEFDTDEDGAISETEYEAQKKGRGQKGHKRMSFSDLDTNEDGTLSETEYDAQKKGKDGKKGKEGKKGRRASFADMDVNGDEVLDKSEVKGRLLAHFDELDTDDSETLSEEELSQGKRGRANKTEE